MRDFKKEDTNPDIELTLEEITKAEQAKRTTEVRSVIDLSEIDPSKPLPGVRERRTHPRLEMKGSIHLHTHMQNVVGSTSDISAGGLGVRVDDRFQFASGVILTIEFRPPSGLNGFLAQVEVIRSYVTADGKKHLGLRIVKCTKLMEQKLVEFIKNAS